MESERDEASHVNSLTATFSSISVPEELITEILLRLPVKSLLHFKSISKSWLHLISSPQFVNTHLSSCANNKDYTHHRLTLGFVSTIYNHLKGCSLSSLLYDSVTEAFDLDYPMKNNTNRYACVVGSVNGLICLIVEQKYFFLWNPSIRKFKKLPDARSGSYSMYGFGYDEVHNDYKIVVVCRYRVNHDLHVAKIYSLNRDSWINIDYFKGVLFDKREGVFVNGRLHWVTTRDFRSYNGCDIITIDLADGKWGKVEKPSYAEGVFFRVCLGVLGSDLSLFCNSCRGYVDVWIMNDYGVKESWTKMITINRPDDIASYPDSPFFCKSNEGEIMFGLRSSFIIYNKKDDSIRYREVINCDTFDEVNIYIESLLWPFSAEGTRDATITKAHM